MRLCRRYERILKIFSGVQGSNRAVCEEAVGGNEVWTVRAASDCTAAVIKKNVPWHILAPRRGCFGNHLPLRRVRILAEHFYRIGNEVSYTMTPVHNRLCTGLFLTYRCALQHGTPGLPMGLRAMLSISECRIRCADAGFRYCRRSPSHASHLHLSRSSCLPERGLRSR